MPDAAPRAPTRYCVDGGEADPGTGALLPADDRGLAYGDGIFRTIRFDARGPWLWEHHLETLARDARQIEIPCDETALRDLERAALRFVNGEAGVLRITLTRGSGPRGYAMPEVSRLRRIFSFTPMLPAPAPDEVVVQFARTTLAHSPRLAGAKHLGRLEQVLANAEPASGQVFERVMCAPSGELVCGTRSNLFLRRGRRLLTPRVDRCGVAGVVRGQLLAEGVHWFSETVDEVAEVELQPDDCHDAEELLLTNAVQGVVAVDRLLTADGEHCARFAGRRGALYAQCAERPGYVP